MSSSRVRSHSELGLILAVVASVTFGTSGIVARSLLDIGWTPIAAVMARAIGAALLLAPLGWRELGGEVHRVRASWRRLVLLGLLGVGGAQVCYFAAVQYLPVGIALLIEFQGPVLLIAWTWMRTRVAPPRLTLVGAAFATVGLFCVLDIGGDGLEPVGLAWAIGSSVCLAAYFHFTGTPDPNEVPALATTAVAMIVGAVALSIIGVSGLLPIEASTDRAELFGASVEWWVPVLAVIVLCTAIPYATSVAAMGRLGARVGSFVSLLELLSAIVFAWIVFGERPTALQGVGGALILVGIVCVQNSGEPVVERRGQASVDAVG